MSETLLPAGIPPTRRRNSAATGMMAGSGELSVPVNAGQQLYDVIAVTDPRAGLDAEKKRVLKMGLVYHPARAQYEMRLGLGNV